jgi:CubicO group peptidase (beta-lactamase class C family)
MTNARTSVDKFLADLIAHGTELGIQVAAYVDGKLALDAWAGIADDETGRMVDGETLFTIYSATKAIVATAIHMLVERGRLRYDEPVATYWPAFAAHGKGATTLRHVLSHQAGIPDLPPGLSRLDTTRWDETCAAIADLTPKWPAGTNTQYHGRTIGHVLGEVLQRVDGRTIRDFVHDEIGRPLGVSDLNIGIAPKKGGRVARLRDAVQPSGPGGPHPTTVGDMNLPAVREAMLPSAGGITNARSLARMYAALANGGELDGVRLLRPETIAAATVPHTAPVDGAREEVNFALGYRLGGTYFSPPSLLRAMSTRSTVFGHSGAGGTMAFADPERHFAIAILHNLTRHSEPGVEFPTVGIVRAVRAALGVAD